MYVVLLTLRIWNSYWKLTNAFIRLNAVSFPRPPKELTVSQPVKACSPDKSSNIYWPIKHVNFPMLMHFVPELLLLFWYSWHSRTDTLERHKGHKMVKSVSNNILLSFSCLRSLTTHLISFVLFFDHLDNWIIWQMIQLYCCAIWPVTTFLNGVLSADPLFLSLASSLNLAQSSL